MASDGRSLSLVVLPKPWLHWMRHEDESAMSKRCRNAAVGRRSFLQAVTLGPGPGLCISRRG